MGTGYLSNHPKMISNARQIQSTLTQILQQIEKAISDLRDRGKQLTVLESNFQKALEGVQKEADSLSKIDDTLRNLERELEIVRASSAQMQKQLNEVTIEQAFPKDQDNPLQKEQFASLPGTQLHQTEEGYAGFCYDFSWNLFCISIFAKEIYRPNRIKSPWDIQVFLGKRDLIAGVKISNIIEQDRPLIVGNDLDDGLAESFRSACSAKFRSTL